MPIKIYRGNELKDAPRRRSEEDTEIWSVRSTTVMGALIGNVAYIAKKFILEQFPEDTFKYVHIDTAISNITLQSEKDMIHKFQKPYLIIRPQVNLNPEDNIFGRLPDWFSTNYYNFKQMRGNYSPVFADLGKSSRAGNDTGDIYIYSVPERTKVQFELEIVADTKLEQINLGHYLRSAILHRGYFYLKDTYLETEVPKYFIKVISELAGFDMENIEDRQDFVRYLESNSQHFITEKTKASTHNPAYFYLYKTNVLVNFEDYPQLDIQGDMKEHTSTNYKVTDTFTFDFWAPMNYFLETKKRFNSQDSKLGWDFDQITDIKLNAHYTTQFFPWEFIEIDGKKYEYLRKVGFIVDEFTQITSKEDIWYTQLARTHNLAYKGTPGPQHKINIEGLDILDLSDFFHRDIQRVIKYHQQSMINNDNVFIMHVYDENRLMSDREVIIDWGNLELLNFNPQQDRTYHLICYVDRQALNKAFDILHIVNEDYYNSDKRIGGMHGQL